jgi:hypothetical protein
MYTTVYDSTANANILTFLQHELMHAIWSLLLTNNFVNAYVFGIVVLYADGMSRQLFPWFLPIPLIIQKNMSIHFDITC